MNYQKAVLAVIATIFTAIIPVLSTSSHVTPSQWINVAITGITAAAVFAAPNIPGARYTKAIIAVLMAVLGFVVTAVANCPSFAGCHLATADWLQMGVLGLNAVGVFAVPNSGS